MPGAHGICFKDDETLYISKTIENKASTGGVITCSMNLQQKEFFTKACSYYSIATGPASSIAVRNGTANELEIYSQQPTKVLSLQLPAGKHKGLAVDDNGQVYICDAESDCIRVYDASGDLAKVIKEKEIKRPQYIALTSTGFVVTCMGEQPATVCANRDGKVIWINDELESPSGVAVDSNNDVYVCDTQERKVVMITNDGEFSFDMVDEHMLKHEKPFAVAVHGDKLAVQMLESDSLKLYRLMG